MSVFPKAGAFFPAFAVRRLAAARLPAFLLLFALLCAGPAAAAQRDGIYPGAELFSKTPLLTIAYCAETLGQVRPCASCGGKLGGLARRAGFIAGLRQEAAPLLFILGPGEFSADLAAAGREQRAREGQLPVEQDESAADAGKVMAAYAALRPQAACLSPEAGRWFRAGRVNIPEFFVPLSKMDGRAASRIVEIGGRTVGLVFFAEADGGLEQARAGALFAGRQLLPRVHLLVGVSPWGFAAEKDFLPEGAGLFHILLGGGSGPGFAVASSAQAGEILWARPAAAGVGVNVISLYRWPEAGPLRWENGLSFEARQEFLGPGLQEDPEIARLFAEP
ncbi:MAG: hypothetical protein LBM64_04940 [Deltaproteobacteria bacterium]|jgi:hypothetical protein|nr:hypothetical protein [Deltaproteobacteria bacterium]